MNFGAKSHSDMLANSTFVDTKLMA
jgi:hypothetical protein